MLQRVRRHDPAATAANAVRDSDAFVARAVMIAIEATQSLTHLTI